MPAPVSRAITSGSTASDSTGTLTTPRSGLRAAWPATAVTIAVTEARCAGSAGRTDSDWPPTSRFRSAGEPCAITAPCWNTEISSARASASSRYWVVSRIVIPSPVNVRMICQTSSRLAGSSPVVGSSR